MQKYLNFVSSQTKKEFYSVSVTFFKTRSLVSSIVIDNKINNEKTTKIEIKNEEKIEVSQEEKARLSRKELDEQTAEAMHKLQEEDKEKGMGEVDAGLG